jgi:hypothetical protein
MNAWKRTTEDEMPQPTYNELVIKLEWSKHQVSQLEAERESWRNKAVLAQRQLNVLEAENLELRQRLAHSLPLYDPDEFIPARGKPLEDLGEDGIRE